jgi:hypothetical protein
MKMIIFRIPHDDLPLPKEKPFARLLAKGFSKFGSSGRTRTCDHSVNSRTLYQLSYRGTNISAVDFRLDDHSRTACFLQEPE